MHDGEVFDLLTEDYSIILATTAENFETVRNMRQEVFNSKYKMSIDDLKSTNLLDTAYDQQAFTYLLKHRKTNTYVGTVRTTFINNKTPLKQLPMQKNGKIHDIDHLINTLPVVEISRAVLIHNLPTHKNYSALKLRSMLTYALMISTRINFYLYHYSRIFTFIEASLNQIFHRNNVVFEKVGKPIISYGTPRISYATTHEKLLKETETNMGKITNYYLKQLCENPEPFWEFIDNNPYLERSDIHLDEICKLFEKYGDNADLTTLLTDHKEDQSLTPTV